MNRRDMKTLLSALVLLGMSSCAGLPDVVRDKDTCVPVSENTAVAERRYRDMGGTIKVIHKEDCGHHPHSLEDPTPIVAFVEKHVERKRR